ncbi:MAG: hypothetical protein HFH08_04670 [Bacilli bacterium]|nr:hypothetical protein [Bacilli bacterium]
MKKKILILVVMMIALFPLQAKAEDNGYHSMNLEEVLKEEGIEHDLSGYTETDDQAVIYLFRGNGCSFCKSFLTFLNSIVPEYGKYFRLESYEVWQDTDNMPLLNGFSNTLKVEVEGVPFIIIGDQYFPGYASVYDDKIKQAIMKQYENKNKDNLIEEAKKNASSEGYVDLSVEDESGDLYNTSKSNSEANTTIILWNLVFVIIGTSVILIVGYMQNKKMEEKMDYILVQMKKQKKAKKED